MKQGRNWIFLNKIHTIVCMRNRSKVNGYPIKERLFIYYMSFFTILSLATVAANVLNGLDFSFNYKWIAIAFFCAVLMVMALKSFHVPVIHRVGTYVITLVLLPASGLSSAGLVSPGIMYSFLILILINYLMNGWERIFLDIAVILINMALIVLFEYSPDVFKQLSSQEQFLDWITNVPVVSSFIVLLLIAFEKAYESERRMNVKHSEKLEELSQTDFLTGLYNRKHLDEKLKFLWDVYLRTGNTFAVLMLDIDFFKEYNDYYGHPAGDACLKTIGSILKKRITRNTDWAYRYGGEEFLILLGFSDERAADIVAKQIQEDLSGEEIVHENSAINEFVTVSIGIACVSEACKTPQRVVEQADQALYISKKNGRNRISLSNKNNSTYH